MCFGWISEQTSIISLYNINWLVFISQTQCSLRGTDWVFIYNSGYSRTVSHHAHYILSPLSDPPARCNYAYPHLPFVFSLCEFKSSFSRLNSKILPTCRHLSLHILSYLPSIYSFQDPTILSLSREDLIVIIGNGWGLGYSIVPRQEEANICSAGWLHFGAVLVQC